MQNILLYACLLLGVTTGYAQKKTMQTNWRYANLTNVGTLNGSSGVKAGFQTIHGIEKKNWMVGIGGGIDDYGVPGFPLFIHGQKHFTKMRHQPFTYLQTGIQFPWYKGEWKNTNDTWMQVNYNLENGFIGEAGFGYAFKLGKKLKLQLSTGYSYKSVRAVETSWPMFISIWPIPDETRNISHVHFQYHRIAVRAGIRF